MKKIVNIVVLATTVMVAGCSTVAGIGQDITNASEWTKEKMK